MEEQEKIKPVGKFRLHDNHKVYKFNMVERELSVVVLDQEKGSNLLVDRECVYFSALNDKNAERKVKNKFKTEIKVKHE